MSITGQNIWRDDEKSPDIYSLREWEKLKKVGMPHRTEKYKKKTEFSKLRGRSGAFSLRDYMKQI